MLGKLVVLTLCLLHRSVAENGQCGQAKNLTSAGKRIVGGVQARPHSIPWIASLRLKDGEHFCGASLVRVNSKEESDIVVTAAHCIDAVTHTIMTLIGPAFDVFLGAHYLSKSEPGELKLRVLKVIKHENFSIPVRNANDIAVIKLEKPVKFSKTISPVCLPEPDETVPDNTYGIVAGWGYLKEGSFVLSDTLQQVLVPTIGFDSCKKSYGTSVDAESMICAGHAKGAKDSCQNDSGGPFVIKSGRGYVMHGAVSFGEGCARPDRPGVYTKVSVFIKWIQERIKELSNVGDE